MYQERDTSDTTRDSGRRTEHRGLPAGDRESSACTQPVTKLSRRTALAASTLLGSAATLTTAAAASGPAAAAVVFGNEASTSRLAVKGTVVGRHRNIFRSFALSGAGGVAVIRVGSSRYLVTTNTGDKIDTVQIFHADTGRLYYKASTPTFASGNLVHDGAGSLYFTSGTALMVVSIPQKSIRRIGTAPAGVTSFQALVLDYKGRLWAGTYPAGIVICYNRTTGKEITRTPRLGSGNHYVRGLSVSADKRTLWAGTGTADPDLFRINVDAPSQPARVSIPGRGRQAFVSATAARGRKVFVWHDDSSGTEAVSVYDTVSRSWARSPVAIAGRSITATDPSGNVYVNNKGTVVRLRTDQATLSVKDVASVNNRFTVHAGLIGSTLYFVTQDGSNVSAARISTAGTKGGGVNYKVVLTTLDTQSIVIDPATHTVYAGGYRGDGVCSTNLATGAFAHSASTSQISQIEGMIVDGRTLYVGSYGNAVIIKHTIASGVRDAGSFTRLARLGESYQQSRPYGWAVAASHIAFGTVPDFGHRGGALGTIDRATGKVKVYNRIIPELSIIGLTASGNTVYGSTSCRAGYGTADYTGSAVVFAADVRTGKVLWKKALSGTKELYGPVLLNGKIYVATLDTVVELRLSNGAPLRTFVLGSRTGRPGWHNAELARIPGTSRLVHASGGTLRVLEPATGRVATVLTGCRNHVSFDGGNALWVAVGNDIVKLRLDATAS